MNETDRELLIWAAKAAGYKKYFSHYLGRDSFVTYDAEYYSAVKERRVVAEKTLDWNPLANDGDALRLAVKLRLGVDPWGAGPCAVVFRPNDMGQIREPHDTDPYAATRRAIVKAAAEIGRNMS